MICFPISPFKKHERKSTCVNIWLTFQHIIYNNNQHMEGKQYQWWGISNEPYIKLTSSFLYGTNINRFEHMSLKPERRNVSYNGHCMKRGGKKAQISFYTRSFHSNFVILLFSLNSLGNSTLKTFYEVNNQVSQQNWGMFFFKQQKCL